MAVTTWPQIRAYMNYCKGETSWERHARKGKHPRIYSAEYDSDDSDGIYDSDEDEGAAEVDEALIAEKS